MDTVVRFTHSSGNIDFFRDEVRILEVKTIRPINLWWSIPGYAHIYYTGDERKEIIITFNLKRSSTIDRIEDLYDLESDATYRQPQVITCYYRYGIDTTTYPVEVQMMRDGMVWPYASGSKESTKLKIRFIESIDFPTVAASVAQQIDLGVS